MQKAFKILSSKEIIQIFKNFVSNENFYKPLKTIIVPDKLFYEKTIIQFHPQILIHKWPREVSIKKFIFDIYKKLVPAYAMHELPFEVIDIADVIDYWELKGLPNNLLDAINNSLNVKTVYSSTDFDIQKWLENVYLQCEDMKWYKDFGSRPEDKADELVSKEIIDAVYIYIGENEGQKGFESWLKNKGKGYRTTHSPQKVELRLLRCAFLNNINLEDSKKLTKEEVARFQGISDKMREADIKHHLGCVSGNKDMLDYLAEKAISKYTE